MPEDHKKEIATNKLLKILRDRDVETPVTPPKAPGPVPEEQEIDDADDLIGMAPAPTAGTATAPVPATPVKPAAEKAAETTVVDQIITKKLPPQKKKEGLAGIVASLQQGVEKDRIVTGLVLDGSMVATASIEDRQGVKWLVDYSLTQILPEILKGDKKDLEKIVSQICKYQLTRNQKKDRRFFRLPGTDPFPGKIAACLTASNTVTKDIELPDVSRKELNDVIAWNATQNLPFSPDNVIIDKIIQVGAQEFEGGEKHLLLGAAEPEKLAESLRPLLDQNIIPRKISTVAYALWSTFVWNYPDPKQENTIVIHLGETTTTLLFVEANVLRFVREFSLGNEDLIKGLPNEITLDGKRVQVTPQVAEAVKYRFKIPLGPAGGRTDDDNTKLFFQIRPELEKMLTEINRFIGQHRRDFPIKSVNRIFFSRASTTFSNLPEYLAESLAKPVIPLDPLRNLNFAVGLKELKRSTEDSVILSSAIGLALNLHRGINLQPKKLQLEETFLVANNILKRVSLFIFVILFILSGMTKLNIMGSQSKLSVEKEIKATLIPVKGEYEKLSRETNAIENLIRIIEGDRNYFQNELTLLKILSNGTPTEINLTYLKFQKGWEKSKKVRIGRKYITEIDVEDPETDYLRLEGVVGSNPVLREALLSHFIESLSISELITHVTIDNKETRGVGSDEKLVFTLKCIL